MWLQNGLYTISSLGSHGQLHGETFWKWWHLSSAFKDKWGLEVEGGVYDNIRVLLPDADVGGVVGAHSTYSLYLRGDLISFLPYYSHAFLPMSHITVECIVVFTCTLTISVKQSYK